MVPKMENNKLNVLDCVILERSTLYHYPDEMVFSNLYHTSFSTQLRALGGYSVKEQAKRTLANEWIHEQSRKSCAVRVINFDRVKDLLNNGSASCDALFYNYNLIDEGFHFISEFKNTERSGKQDLLRLLNCNDQDGIYRKVKDSVENIRHNLLFGGKQEADEIIQSMHVFVVYNGKNNAATSNKPSIPSRKEALRDTSGKQTRAIRFGRHEYSQKDENEIYTRFGNKIEALGLKPCTENTFPGNAIPRVRKSERGSEKIRFFTIFSAQDFGDLIDSGFFNNWNWGQYLPNSLNLAENT